jgi:hypothetical protein
MTTAAPTVQQALRAVELVVRNEQDSGIEQRFARANKQSLLTLVRALFGERAIVAIPCEWHDRITSALQGVGLDKYVMEGQACIPLGYTFRLTGWKYRQVGEPELDVMTLRHVIGQPVGQVGADMTFVPENQWLVSAAKALEDAGIVPDKDSVCYGPGGANDDDKYTPTGSGSFPFKVCMLLVDHYYPQFVGE